MKTLSEIEKEFACLSEEKLKSIVGGGGITLQPGDLNTIFDFSGIGGLNSVQGQRVAHEIQELAKTDIGGTVMSQLLSSITQDPTKRIELIDNVILAPTTVAYYSNKNVSSDGKNQLNVYNLEAKDVINDITQDSRAFYFVAHELYHAWDNIVNGHFFVDSSAYEVTNEVDAQLFAGFASVQLDRVTGKQVYYSSGPGAELAQPGFDPNYKQSFEDIVLQDNFNLTDYNNLIDLEGSVYGPGYGVMKKDHATDLTTDALYSKLFSTSVILPNPISGGIPPSYYTPAPIGSYYSSFTPPPSTPPSSSDPGTTPSTGSNPPPTPPTPPDPDPGSSDGYLGPDPDTGSGADPRFGSYGSPSTNPIPSYIDTPVQSYAHSSYYA